MKSSRTVKDNSQGVSCQHKGYYWDGVGQLNSAVDEVTPRPLWLLTCICAQAMRRCPVFRKYMLTALGAKGIAPTTRSKKVQEKKFTYMCAHVNL